MLPWPWYLFCPIERSEKVPIPDLVLSRQQLLHWPFWELLIFSMRRICPRYLLHLLSGTQNVTHIASAYLQIHEQESMRLFCVPDFGGCSQGCIIMIRAHCPYYQDLLIKLSENMRPKWACSSSPI